MGSLLGMGQRGRPKAGRGSASDDLDQLLAEVPALEQAEEGPKKPPAAWISSDVYSRLLEYSDQEKRTRRSAARPFGVIALDAIESHAAELASSWKGSGGDFPHPGPKARSPVCVPGAQAGRGTAAAPW